MENNLGMNRIPQGGAGDSVSTFRMVNADSQGGERLLSFVMKLNAAEIEWYEPQVQLIEPLEEVEKVVRP